MKLTIQSLFSLSSRRLTAASLVVALASSALADSTVCVSTDVNGAPGNNAHQYASTSTDGRYTAYWSLSSTLVPGDTNGVSDIFVIDLVGGTVTRVSVGINGVQANGESRWPSISSNGRYVAFESVATNLIGTNDTNNAPDFFVHDLQTHITGRVSVASGGTQSPLGGTAGSSAFGHALSADGRYVTFTSVSPLVANDLNGVADVFVYDRIAAQTTRVSVSTSGAESNQTCWRPAISPDGRFVAFDTIASTLVVGDANAKADVFVRDRNAATTTRISVASGGAESNGESTGASFSTDGRYVVFASAGTNLVVGDTNGRPDVFLRDRQTATTTRVSVATGGAQTHPVNGAGFGSISGDARFVAFTSDAADVVAGDTNNVADVFLHDRQFSMTTRISVSSTWAQGDRQSNIGVLSADGSCIAFDSHATNFEIPNGFGVARVYLRMRDVVPDKFCFGDGSGTACPCGNPAPTVNDGCRNSSGVGGRLLASGSASLANDTLHLNGFNQPWGTLGLFFQGTGQAAGGLGTSFGDGLLCLANITRLGVKPAPSGGSTYGASPDPKISVQGGVTAPGMRFYQLWYRDSAAYCTSLTYNLTNGLIVEWKP